LPDFVIKFGMDIFVWISYNLNMDLKILGIEHDHFGQLATYMVDF